MSSGFFPGRRFDSQHLDMHLNTFAVLLRDRIELIGTVRYGQQSPFFMAVIGHPQPPALWTIVAGQLSRRHRSRTIDTAGHMSCANFVSSDVDRGYYTKILLPF